VWVFGILLIRETTHGCNGGVSRKERKEEAKGNGRSRAVYADLARV